MAREASAQLRRRRIAAAAILLLACAGCQSGRLKEPVHKMGEITAVGPVIYNVLESEWLSEIGTSVTQKIPQHRFLVLRLTISNSGNREVAVPLLSIETADGASFLELSEVEGLPNWLGLLRILEPASNIAGTIIFDVPPGDYLLRVTDGADVDSERTALIEIPMNLSVPSPVEPPSPDSGL